MTTAKIAISMDQALLRSIDALVAKHLFKNRSQAIQKSIEGQLRELQHKDLELACSMLDTDEERAFADEGLHEDLKEWPAY